MSAGSGAVAARESTELLTGSHFRYFVIVIMVNKPLVRRKMCLQSPWPLPPLLLLMLRLYCVSVQLCAALCDVFFFVCFLISSQSTQTSSSLVSITSILWTAPFFFLHLTSLWRVGIGGVIEGCQQLPYNTPGLTW